MNLDDKQSLVKVIELDNGVEQPKDVIKPLP